jgi:hypothetical protein
VQKPEAEILASPAVSTADGGDLRLSKCGEL